VVVDGHRGQGLAVVAGGGWGQEGWGALERARSR